jgi:hypothetical protein
LHILICRHHFPLFESPSSPIAFPSPPVVNCRRRPQSREKVISQKLLHELGGTELRGDEKELENTVARLRDARSKYEEARKLVEDRSLQWQWRRALRLFGASTTDGPGGADYPRMERLFRIVREDGKIRLMLGYDKENPRPDFMDNGQRRQVEALLQFEQPLVQLMEEAGNLWRAGNFDGEAALLEDYAILNPQREAILQLAEEARRDALSGASTQSRPKRR